jgi:hypothetical protein
VRHRILDEIVVREDCRAAHRHPVSASCVVALAHTAASDYKETIPSGISIEEAVSRIKAQGGLVSIPHPFDPLARLKDGAPAYQTLVII